MNKAQQLLEGLKILSKFNMDELELTPIPSRWRVNPEQSCVSAYLSVHIPFKDSLNLENDTKATQALYDLGWGMEQYYEYWIFRD